MSYDTWKSTEPDDHDWMQCDCCGRRASRLHCTMAYGVEAYACDECRGAEPEPDGTFRAEDYAFTAELLRRYMNGNRSLFQAVASNNLSIILAALDRAAAAPRDHGDEPS